MRFLVETCILNADGFARHFGEGNHSKISKTKNIMGLVSGLPDIHN